MGKTTAYRSFAISALLAAWTVPAFASDARPTPQTTTATYQDWTLRCDNGAGDPPRRLCEVAHFVRGPDGSNGLAQLVIGRPAPDRPLQLIIQVPAGVWLPGGATLTVDGKELTNATYKRCMQLCYADAGLDDQAIATLKAAAGAVKLIFADGAQRMLELPVSTDGLVAALEESQRQHTVE